MYSFWLMRKKKSTAANTVKKNMTEKSAKMLE